MRILLLSDSDSPHTIKWAKAIHSSGFEVSVFSIHSFDRDLYKDFPSILLFSGEISKKIQNRPEAALSKLLYIIVLKRLKKVIEEFKPDIIHAHYISSYGLLGALMKCHPFLTSVWGADIFNFPKHSYLHKALIKFILSRSDLILSTSKVMKSETLKYTEKSVHVTPFGVDTSRFYPFNTKPEKENEVTIGTVKTLEKKYGIEFLIHSFHKVKLEIKDIKLKLMIVGKGSQEKYLKNLVQQLKLEDSVVFAGYVTPDLVPRFHNSIDITVFPSTEDSESFGVSVLEASACGKPVIVSAVGGLPEVVEDGVTGLIVKKCDIESLTGALLKLIKSKDLRNKLGISGRNKVINEYDWKNSVLRMIEIYHDVTIRGK